MSTKKVILFIIEGITDEICLGYVLSRLLSEQIVGFEKTYGDITTKDGYDRAKIAAKVGDTVKDFMGRYFLKPSDIKEVVHLVDLDGAYISDDKVIQAACQKPFYTDENIQTSNVDGIQRRNQQKTENLNRLISLGKVYKNIPYKVFFFSCNLDHVLHDAPNLSRLEKDQYAKRFESEYADQPSIFLDFLGNQQYSVGGDYQQTWDFIKLDTNSLHRHTNFHLYFNNLVKNNAL